MAENICPKYLIPDQECVLRAQKGEYDTIRVLYERYYDTVIWYISCKISESADVQEIASLVFTEVIEDINKLEKPDCFQKWLYTIVNHRITDFYRKRKANKIDLIDDLPAQTEDERFE
jgi:RNA polymerase sigma factor (sigma-70 family)